MGYSNFKKIQQVTKKFSLDVTYSVLFENITDKEPSVWLLESLRRAKLSPPTNEKSKAERIVSPILLEILDVYVGKLSFFSGESVDIDSTQDLAEECDFIFSLHPPKPFLDAPIISLAESKDEDMEWGIAQCAAQIYGTKLFNEQNGKNLPTIYGCATDGVEWQFIKLENNVFYLHPEVLTDLPQILGTWHWIIQQFVK